MESPDGQMFMKFSSVVCRLDDNPQVLPASVGCSLPARNPPAVRSAVRIAARHEPMR